MLQLFGVKPPQHSILSRAVVPAQSFQSSSDQRRISSTILVSEVAAVLLLGIFLAGLLTVVTSQFGASIIRAWLLT